MLHLIFVTALATVSAKNINTFVDETQPAKPTYNVITPLFKDCATLNMMHNAMIAEQLKVKPNALDGFQDVAKNLDLSIDWKGMLNYIDSQAPPERKFAVENAIKHCNADLLVKHVQTGKAEWKDLAQHFIEHMEAAGFSPELGALTMYRSCPEVFATSGRIMGYWDIMDPQDKDFLMEGRMVPKDGSKGHIKLV